METRGRVTTYQPGKRQRTPPVEHLYKSMKLTFLVAFLNYQANRKINLLSTFVITSLRFLAQ